MNSIKEYLKKNKKIFRFLRTINRISRSLRKEPFSFIGYIKDYINYKKLQKNNKSGLGNINLQNLYPCLGEKTKQTNIDYSYFYQDTRAAGKIFQNKPKLHIDIGSTALLVGIISQFTKTISIDIRPIPIHLKNLFTKKGSITNLPFDNNSIESLSSLCVIEHIGLGRYGDELNPNGSEEAFQEIARIMKPGGNVYISVPIENGNIYFNAHRTFTVECIKGFFKKFSLKELKFIDDKFLKDGKEIKRIDFFNSTVIGLFNFVKDNNEKE